MADIYHLHRILYPDNWSIPLTPVQGEVWPCSSFTHCKGSVGEAWGILERSTDKTSTRLCIAFEPLPQDENLWGKQILKSLIIANTHWRWSAYLGSCRVFSTLWNDSWKLQATRHQYDINLVLCLSNLWFQTKEAITKLLRQSNRRKQKSNLIHHHWQRNSSLFGWLWPSSGGYLVFLEREGGFTPRTW